MVSPPTLYGITRRAPVSLMGREESLFSIGQLYHRDPWEVNSEEILLKLKIST